MSDIPFKGTWSQPLGAANLPSQVTANFDLTPKSLNALNIRLPDGSLTGAAEGALRLDIAKNKPVTFELTSDLIRRAVEICSIKLVETCRTNGTVAGARDPQQANASGSSGT